MGRNNPSAHNLQSRQDILTSIHNLELSERVPKRFYGVPSSKFKQIISTELSKKEKEVNKAYQLRIEEVLGNKSVGCDKLFDELEGKGLVREILENPFSCIENSYFLDVRNKRFPKQEEENLKYGEKLGRFTSDIVNAFKDYEEEQKVFKMIDFEMAYTDDAILFTLEPNSVKLSELRKNSFSRDVFDLPLDQLEYSGIHPTNFERLYK